MKSLDEQARYILSLKDDWDDEGSAAYTEGVVKRAVSFVEKTLTAYKAQSYQSLDNHDITPRMSPGPNGSIDVMWKFVENEILLNIDRGIATFYGDNHGGNTIKGTWDIDKPAGWLIFWLTN